jgi:hypothetical protein
MGLGDAGKMFAHILPDAYVPNFLGFDELGWHSELFFFIHFGP